MVVRLSSGNGETSAQAMMWRIAADPVGSQRISIVQISGTQGRGADCCSTHAQRRNPHSAWSSLGTGISRNARARPSVKFDSRALNAGFYPATGTVIPSREFDQIILLWRRPRPIDSRGPAQQFIGVRAT
jgi:hypothetical protein